MFTIDVYIVTCGAHSFVCLEDDLAPKITEKLKEGHSIDSVIMKTCSPVEEQPDISYVITKLDTLMSEYSPLDKEIIDTLRDVLDELR